MSWLHFATLTAVVGIGALLQSSIGFGLGLFTVPFLVLLNPRLVPGPILLASGALTLLMVHRESHAIRVPDLKWSLSGRVVGTLAAMLLLVVVPERRIEILFALLILGSVALSASGLHPALSPRVLVGAGTLSGFMATAVSIGGPPMAILYQKESGPSIRATLSAFFVVGTVLSLAGLHLVGKFGMEEARLSLALLPGIILGFGLSRFTTRMFDQGLLRPAILAVSALTAVALLLKEIF